MNKKPEEMTIGHALDWFEENGEIINAETDFRAFRNKIIGIVLRYDPEDDKENLFLSRLQKSIELLQPYLTDEKRGELESHCFCLH